MAYLLPLAVFSIFAGVQSDKMNRVKLLSIGSIVWSVLTIFHSRASNLGGFVGMRILFGVMSSILNPAALSLLRDYFPEKERGKANAIFYQSISFGAAACALTNFVVEKYGWKKDYIGTGLIGVIFGLIGFTLRIPKRGQYDEE